VVHYDLGILFYEQRDFESAIGEYKKAIALEPDDATFHSNLGFVFKSKGDIDAAIREYREAKRLDPNFLDARNNLARTLAERDVDAATLEFKELVAIAPDFEVCRVCFGSALLSKGDRPAPPERYRKAVKLDPSDPDAHCGLGLIFEKQNNYDAAVAEFRTSQRLDADSVGAHKGLGRIFLAKKEFANAVRELKPAESLAPSQWQTHDLLGDALTGTGDFDGAIAEYKEALQIWPKNAAVMLKLAASLEKKEDLIGALEQYRLAAETQRDDKARAQYAAAQKRINAHIQSLKVSGHSGEAAELESRLTATYAASNNPEAEWQASVDAGIDALGKGHYEDSQAFLRTAVSLAEKLQPRDYRLTRTIGQLGHMYQNQQKFPEAAGEFRAAVSGN